MDEKNFKSIKPTGGRLLTTRKMVNEITPSGIIMVNKQNVVDTVQTVVEVGPNVTQCKVGDKVIFDPEMYLVRKKKWVKNPITQDEQEVDDNKYMIPVYLINGEEVLMIEERSLIAVVEL